MPDLQNERCSRGGTSRSLLVAALALFGTIAIGPSLASGGDECKEIELSGAAGLAGSSVTIRVVDARPSSAVMPEVTDADILSESCTQTILPGTTAADLIRRLPDFWGDGLGGTSLTNDECKRKCTAPPASATPVALDCTLDSDCDQMAGDGVCGKRPRIKKACTTKHPGLGPYCNVEARVTQVKGKCLGGSAPGASCLRNADCPGLGICPGANTVNSCIGAPFGYTCAKRRSLRICCRANAGCGGAKLEGADTIPITVQTMITGTSTSDCTVGDWCPADAAVPDTNTHALRFKADPIDGRSGPSISQRACRSALLSAEGAVTQAAYGALDTCHKKVLAGTLSAGACDDADAVVNASTTVQTKSGDLHDTIVADCQASGRSPTDFGYDACPEPCDSIVLELCSGGQVGQPCARNRECDTGPLAGDGVCGNWSTMESCSLCQAKAAGIAAAEEAYGETELEPSAMELGPSAFLMARLGRSVSVDARDCQIAIGTEVGSLLAVNLKDMAKCQASVDAFKTLLPDGTPRCKDADPKGKRARARSIAGMSLTLACNDTELMELDTCAANVLGLVDCVAKVADQAAAAVADAAAPEGRCGDGQFGFGEQCDDGNTIDGDGCDSNCTLTGCGNGVVTAGEQCDDGNTISGDGCSPTCIGDPCAPQMCGAYSYDCSTSFPGGCACLRAAEGGGSCVNNFNCATAQVCNVSSECAPGEVCFLDTCCGPPGSGVCGAPTCSGP